MAIIGIASLVLLVIGVNAIDRKLARILKVLEKKD